MPRSRRVRKRVEQIGRVGLVCIACAVIAPAQQPILAGINAPAAPPPEKHAKHKPSEPAALQPNASIPVGPLGFAPPAPFYLGDRISQVSLNFLDEDDLLFTFRIPGLIARDTASRSAGTANPEVNPEPNPEKDPPIDPSSAERNIRAIVLSLPAGRVVAEDVWRLHDYSPYLWTLRGGKFLLRDRNAVKMGSSDLQLTPFLRFPGFVKFLQMDPSQQYLIADSIERASGSDATRQEASSNPAPELGPLHPGTSTDVVASGTFTLDQSKAAPATTNFLRILRLDTRHVLLTNRVNGIASLPIDGDGYYEALRGSGFNWAILYSGFDGSSIRLVQMDSTCYPALDVQAPGILLATGCNPLGGRTLAAVTRVPGQPPLLVWQDETPPTSVWPQLTHAADGLRFARSTLEVTHPIGPSSPLDASDIRGQKVEVYDLATGHVALSLPVSPVLDGGGNFALSPSGNRLAVLNAGAVQVYDLPAPPPLSAVKTAAASAKPSKNP